MFVYFLAITVAAAVEEVKKEKQLSLCVGMSLF